MPTIPVLPLGATNECFSARTPHPASAPQKAFFAYDFLSPGNPLSPSRIQCS